MLTIDGQFTVCRWGETATCDALDKQREKALRLTPTEQKNLDELRRYSAAKSFNGKDLIASFGQPWTSFKDPADTVNIIWLYDQREGHPASSFGMVFVDNKLSIITYKVPNKFSIIWYAKLSK
ncbi:hypothetical protein OOT46_29865 [Aquabacterium sp. A7-Y]|uniref:hypothetical protein n=1 Tax=Aquabacterium sp. A7-Y TaxID=1349605 RepID=UPI00223E00BE|nr:hypothetical protein [Aquabacterium sp. A7-Y]MCW7542008.1 hypothetical protein [Aquabacterium sp. A7-Y]